MPIEHVDVVVAGAGLAGLVAARDLHDLGRRVVVVEARDRVGGRTWSVPFPGTGTIVDLGAEWISPRHTALLAEYDRYGVELAPPADPAARWRLGGALRAGDLPLAAAESEAVETVFGLLAAEAALLRARGPEAYEPSPGYDRSFEELLEARDVAGPAYEALFALGYALMGAAPAEYAASALVREVAAFGGDPHEAFTGSLRRAVGGADLVSRRIAAELDVRYERPVAGVAAEPGGVTVTLGDGTGLVADACVLAVPLNVLAGVAVEPAPPADVRAFAAQRHAGRAVKTWLRASGVEAGQEMIGFPAPLEAYSIAGDGGGVLVCAFQLADDAATVDAPLAEGLLRDFAPGIAVDELLGHDWNADPHARGTWLAARPGQWNLQKAFWRPSGRTVFAGADVAREWAGWMEGAVRSGHEAAGHVRALLA